MPADHYGQIVLRAICGVVIPSLARNFNAKFGQLEKGYKTDLTICDYAALTPLQAENIAGHLAFVLSSANVDRVMIDGVMVYENRQFTFDHQPIYAEVKKIAANLWQ